VREVFRKLLTPLSRPRARYASTSIFHVDSREPSAGRATCRADGAGGIMTVCGARFFTELD